MNTTNAAVGAGVVVVLGRWSEGDLVDIRVVIGVLIVAFVLAALPDEVAEPFAWLILIGCLWRYAENILRSAGMTQEQRNQRRRRGGGMRMGIPDRRDGGRNGGRGSNLTPGGTAL